ncbi:MAG: hypothetical protein ACRDQB_12600, partial [Thermocrispum sp.]
VASLGAASGLRERPVVLRLPDAEPSLAVRHFAERGMRVITLAPGATRVRPADPVVPGLDNRDLSAQQLLHMVRTLRRPVEWRDPVTGRPRVSLVAAVKVELGGPGGGSTGGRRRPLLLVGEWESPRGWPETCWITDLADLPPASLLRLTKLSLRVDLDFDEVSTQVGLVDFAGRSFGGWHRHVTLASAAHAVRVLSAGTAGAGRRLERTA